MQSSERELAERERELTEWAETRERELATLTELAESRGRQIAELAERELAETDREPPLRSAEARGGQRAAARTTRRAAERAHRAGAGRADSVTPASHLVFVQLDERYALISRDGPPPAPSTPLLLPDVDEGSFVVAGLRHSPLPGDERPCVFVHRG